MSNNVSFGTSVTSAKLTRKRNFSSFNRPLLRELFIREKPKMLRAVLAVAAVASAVTPYPKGAYKGQDKFLGQKIGAELTVKNSTHLDIQLFGALGISCQDEPYTFTNNEINGLGFPCWARNVSNSSAALRRSSVNAYLYFLY